MAGETLPADGNEALPSGGLGRDRHRPGARVLHLLPPSLGARNVRRGGVLGSRADGDPLPAKAKARILVSTNHHKLDTGYLAFVRTFVSLATFAGYLSRRPGLIKERAPKGLSTTPLSSTSRRSRAVAHNRIATATRSS